MAVVYESSIDQEQINGAFALAVDVRFDDLSVGPSQDVFELSDEAGGNVIRLSQVGDSSDIEFVIEQNGQTFRVVAENAIIEGEYATFRVGVDPAGDMRIAKNTDLLVEEPQGAEAVPVDVERTNDLIGESGDPAGSDLDGVVLNLKIANYGDLAQLRVESGESPCAITGEATCMCDKLYPDGEFVAGNNGPTFLPTIDPEGDGEWSAVQSHGVVAIHSIVLPDGKVLSFGANENGAGSGRFVYTLYDPETGVDKILPNTTPTDLFCSNMSIDPRTGNVLIMGGDERGEGGTINHGVNDVNVFDYRTETIRPSTLGEMEFARWYGSSINLPNGEIFHIGGIDDVGGESKIPEIYNPDTGFRTLTGANMTDLGGAGYFPHTWVNSRGEIIILEARGNDIFRVSTEGVGSYEKIGEFPFSSGIQQPSIMFDQDKIARIANDGGLWVADISETVPTFVKVAQLQGGRYDAGMTVLPDGSVAITGGGRNYNTLEGAHYAVEIWNPADNSVIVQDSASIARLYHSSHVLLADGTIFVAGGGVPGPLINGNFEIFSPAYLYDETGNLADRPVISAAPSNIEAGETFRMTVEDAAQIEKVTVSKSGAMTHGRNTDARFLSLDHTVVDATTIEVSTPNNFVMTPGVWMLFTVDVNGAPSHGEMLGVNMAPLIETPNFAGEDGLLAIYGIDDDPIDGAFEATVEARFDQLDGRESQRVFDLGNGPNADNIVLTQLGASNDMAFEIYVGPTRSRIVAEDAIDEGVVAKWAVGVDAGGYMRLWKNDVLVAEGQGAVPRDVERDSNLIGKSNWTAHDDLQGEARFLEIVNEGDAPEYVHLGLPTATLLGPESIAEGAAGETQNLVYTLQLDRPAQNVVVADIAIRGSATGPAQIVIPSGETSGEFVLEFIGDDVAEAGERLVVSLENLTQARSAASLTVSATVLNDDGDAGPVPVFSAPGPVFDGGLGSAVVLPHDVAMAVAQGAIELRVTLANLIGRQALFSKDSSGYDSGGHVGIFAEEGAVRARLQSTNATHEILAPGVLRANEEQHIVLSFGPAGMTLYNYGVEAGANAYAGGLTGNDLPIVLGANAWVASDAGGDALQDPLNGEIAAARLYAQQLTAEQAAALAAGAPPIAATPPVAVDDAATVLEDGSVLIDALANDSDPENEAITLLSVDGAAHGAVAIENGQIRYTPDADFDAADRFSYVIQDASGGQASATVSVAVTPVDDAPEAVDDSAATAFETPVAIDLLANDSAAEGAISVTAVGDAANGSVVIANGVATYTPNAGFSGQDSFSYTISDGEQTDQATATIAVAPDQPPPPAGPVPILNLNGLARDQATIEAHDDRYALASGSVEVVFNLDQAPAGRAGLFSKDAAGFGDGGHFTAYVANDDILVRLQTETTTTTLNALNVVTAQKDHHLVVTFGEGGFELFLDGEMLDFQAFVGGVEQNQEDWVIGGNQWLSAEGQTNRIDDVIDGAITVFRLYDAALSDEEVADQAAEYTTLL